MGRFINLRELRIAVILYVVLPTAAAAQFTTVSGTVTDPNGLPYAGGTISATLISSGTPTLSGLPYTPPSQPTGLNSAGSFTLQLGDNTVLQPGGTQWKFIVCSGVATVQPAIGKGPICFTAGPITISGSSQSITATLTAAALALTVPVGGGGVSGPGSSTLNAFAKWNNTGGTALANSLAVDNGTTLTYSGTGGLSAASLANTPTGTLSIGTNITSGKVQIGSSSAGSTVASTADITTINDRAGGGFSAGNGSGGVQLQDDTLSAILRLTGGEFTLINSSILNITSSGTVLETNFPVFETGSFVSGNGPGGTFTLSGCTPSALVGGNTAGQFTSGTTGTCSTTITFGTNVIAPHGWNCAVSDRNTAAVGVTTASSTTTATISVPTTSGNTVSFSCMGY